MDPVKTRVVGASGFPFGVKYEMSTPVGMARIEAVGALAEGLGIRAVARVFEVDPNTVLQWLVETADHLTAFSQCFLHDVRVTQVQLDELYALLRAVKDGEVSEMNGNLRRFVAYTKCARIEKAVMFLAGLAATVTVTA